MKRSILSIILLALIISLTATVGSANLITAYALENYLQLDQPVLITTAEI